MSHASCPDEVLLVRYANQQLSAVEEEGIIKHICTCEACREFIALQIRVDREPTCETASDEELDRATSEVIALNEQDEIANRKN